MTTTALNSLADSGVAASDEINNSDDLYLFDDVELYTGVFGVAPSAGAVVELYAVLADLDGTGYEDGESVAPPASNLVGVFNIRAVTNAQTHVLRHVPIPPSAVNTSGSKICSVYALCVWLGLHSRMEQSDTAIAPAAEPRNEDSAKEFSPNETTVAQVVRKRKIRYELGTVIKLISR